MFAKATRSSSHVAQLISDAYTEWRADRGEECQRLLLEARTESAALYRQTCEAIDQLGRDSIARKLAGFKDATQSFATLLPDIN